MSLPFDFFLPFVTTALVSACLTPVVIRLYRYMRWIDTSTAQHHPKHVHTTPVPRGGGIIIFVAILVGTLWFLPLDKHLIGILLGAGVLAVTGVWDDIVDLHPYIRLGLGVLAASCVIGAGIGIPFVSNPFTSGVIQLHEPQLPFYLFGEVRTIWILADFFALIWILAIMNFVNWSKGLDGQLPGTVVAAALVIAVLSQTFSSDITQWGTGLLAVVLAGAYAGFLPWNFFPQKIMPGYGGGTLAGYFLAVLAILSTTKVGTLLIVLGVPLIDAIFVIIRRLLQGKSPIWGDTRHLHHTLLRLGWSKPLIALFYWGITALLGVVALQLNSQQKFYTIISLITTFGLVLLWFKWLGLSSSPQDPINGPKT